MILLFLSVLLPSPASAGAWTQPEGSLQLINTLHYYRTDQYRDTNGAKRSQPAFTKYEYNPYLEYGYRDDCTLGASSFIHRLSNNGVENTGIADTEVFFRKRFYNADGFVVSVEPTLKLPSLYEKNALPKSGSDDFDAVIKINSGYGFSVWGKNHYADATLGYRKRFGDRNDQILANATLGFALNNDWMLMPQLFGTFRTENTTLSGFTQSAEDEYDLVKLQLSVLYALDDSTRLQLGGYRHLYTRNSGLDGGFLLSLWKQF